MNKAQNVDKAYEDLVKTVLNEGKRKPNRTGIDTLSYFGYSYKLDLRDGFPLLTTKKISWKNIVVELLWFLTGETSAALLEKHGCKFWRPWYNENQEVTAGYGVMWRGFPDYQKFPMTDDSFFEQRFDQIKFIVEEIKRNPMSRRLVLTAWNPPAATKEKLPPCHLLAIFNVQLEGNKKVLNCHLTQRSADIGLGVPYNIASYALLTHFIAKLTGLEVGEFHHTLVDAHIYTTSLEGKFAGDTSFDHIAPLTQQIVRDHSPLPTLSISLPVDNLECIPLLTELDTDKLLEVFKLENYVALPEIKMKVAV